MQLVTIVTCLFLWWRYIFGVSVFTARCYGLERGYATVRRLSIRPSATFRHHDHIAWNTSKNNFTAK